MTSGSPSGLWRELADLISPQRPLSEVLHDLTQLTVRYVEPAEECSITLLSGTSAWSAAHVGNLAQRLDENQFRIGHGPCLDAGTAGETLTIMDPDEDDRWPAYLSVATVVGLGSSVSVPLPLQQEMVGALNVYSRSTHAFDPAAVRGVQEIAAPVAAVIGHAQLTSDLRRTAEQLHETMRTRAVIEQAKGILMAVRRCSAQDAFEVLRQMAEKQERPLRDVAVDVLSQASGQSPESLG